MIIITLSNLGNYVWYVPSMYSNRIHEHFIKNFFRNFHSFLKSAWMISAVDSLTESRTKDSGVMFDALAHLGELWRALHSKGGQRLMRNIVLHLTTAYLRWPGLLKIS